MATTRAIMDLNRCPNSLKQRGDAYQPKPKYKERIQ